MGWGAAVKVRLVRFVGGPAHGKSLQVAGDGERIKVTCKGWPTVYYERIYDVAVMDEELEPPPPDDEDDDDEEEEWRVRKRDKK